ncbi:hypothetical protein CASFOL_000796 [Castilleja foliolosa]|uniref:RNase H type-1 domain-containing protein n=1 Tax=Castilleja foliolosa TaxID=1961234 RepID=A0ABD3EL86_9LAMI
MQVEAYSCNQPRTQTKKGYPSPSRTPAPFAPFADPVDKALDSLHPSWQFRPRRCYNHHLEAEFAFALSSSFWSMSKFRWIPPNEGVYKLNVDGAYVHKGLAGVGGSLRDLRGKRLAGFREMLSDFVDNMVEFQAVKVGLDIVKEQNYNLDQVVVDVVETDSKIVEETLANNGPTKGMRVQQQAIIKEVRNYMTAHKGLQVNHIMRETNGLADRLALTSKNLKGSCGCWWFTTRLSWKAVSGIS